MTLVYDRGTRATIIVIARVAPGHGFMLLEPIVGRHRVTLWRGRRIVSREWVA